MQDFIPRSCALVLAKPVHIVMGNSESTAPGNEPVGDSHLKHYSQLFRELTAPDHAGKPVDDKIFRVREF